MDWPTAEQVTNETKSGLDALQKRIGRYDHAYEVYRPEPYRRKRGEWEAHIRTPFGMQVVDTAMVNIISGPPRAKVRPRRPQDSDTAPKMQTVLDYHVHEDHLAEKQPLFVQQALIYGITCAKIHWLYTERDRPFRHLAPNPADPQFPLQIEGRERVVLRDGPTFEPWDMYEVFWEPNARDVDTASYVALGSWMDKDELLRNARTETNPFGLFDLAAVNKLLEAGTDEAPRSSAQERYVGGSFDKRKDRFHVIEVWRDETFTIMGGKTVVLNHAENPYWHGRKPVVITQVRPDLFEMQGISETELLDDLQQGLWTIQDAVFDNMKMTVHRGITYRETVPDPNAFILRPRFRWPVTDHDDVKFVEAQPLPPEAFREREVMKSDMQLVTGINPYVSGADQTGVDQNTATGVTALQEVASRLLRFKARMIAYKGLQRTFEMWGELVQQFMDKDQAIRIEGAEGYSWAEVSPQEIVGNYDYTVEGTEESLSKQQERGELMALVNGLAPLANLNIVNWRPIAERIAKAYDIPPEQIIQQQQPTPPAAPTGNGNAAAAQTQPDPMAANGQQYDPRVQQAILGGGG